MWDTHLETRGACEIKQTETLSLRYQIWVFPKIGKHPKMDGEIHGKPY